MFRSHPAMMFPAMVLLLGIPFASAEGLRSEVAMERMPPTAAEPPQPPVVQKIVLHGVDFDDNRPRIRPDAAPVLDAAVQYLSDEHDVIVIVATPATSAVSAPFDRILASRRAKAVRRYLVDHGIAASRITIETFDKPGPQASSAAAGNRVEHFGVELHIN